MLWNIFVESFAAVGFCLAVESYLAGELLDAALLGFSFVCNPVR